MKKDRKYFIDNLTCFVSRFRSSGGVDTIRSYAVSHKLPPMTPKGASHSQPGHRSEGSNVSSSSGHRGASSMSSTSFELGGESSDEFSAQEGDPLSAPSTGESMERPLGPELELKIRTATEQATPAIPAPLNLYHLLRGPVLESGDNFYNMKVNPLRKPAAISQSDFDQGPLTPRSEPSSASTEFCVIWVVFLTDRCLLQCLLCFSTLDTEVRNSIPLLHAGPYASVQYYQMIFTAIILCKS